MGLIVLVFMLSAGGGLAVFVLAAMAIARREHGGGDDPLPPRRDAMAASLLFHVIESGGVSEEEALRQVRRGGGMVAPVTRGIDAGNWAESYARVSTPQQRTALLETAVRLVADRGKPVPMRQYAALLDLSFGLGFQTDALAKLRQLYGFEYAGQTAARPAGVVLFEGKSRQVELLRVLGLEGRATRQELSAAYRRLVSQHHPDRFHGAAAEARSEAAARFIEITRAYEELLLTTKD